MLATFAVWHQDGLSCAHDFHVYRSGERYRSNAAQLRSQLGYRVVTWIFVAGMLGRYIEARQGL